jgi:hypothetical protein
VVVGSYLWLAGCAARVWSWVGRDGTPGHVREYRALTALGFVLRGFMTIMSYSGYSVVELVTIQDPLTFRSTSSTQDGQEIGHHVVCTQVRHPPVATAKCQVHLIVPRRRPLRDLPGGM